LGEFLILSIREKFISIVDNDCLRPSDVIILLEGDGYNRYKHAAGLYKAKLAPLIVFSGGIVNYKFGSYPFSDLEEKLVNIGVDKKVLIHESISLNTREQAEEVFKLAIKNEWKKLILVGSSEHQYRAYLTFLRVLLDKKLDFFLFNSPARNLPWFEKSDWGIRYERLDQEFEKIEKYTELGHLATFNEAIEYQRWKEKLISSL